MHRSPRQPRTVSDLLNRRLNLYATAASAAGVSLLAFAQPANAKIVYTPVTVTIAPNTTYGLDLNNDGITDFTLVQHSYPGYSATLSVGNSLNGVGARAGVKSCNCDSAFALKPGAFVGPARAFMSNALMTKVKKIQSSIRSFGLWKDQTDRYLGLKFTVNGTTHYGWARFSVQSSLNGVTATLTGYAYESVPNKAIRAGQTSGAAADSALDAAPNESGSLGSLARGAAK